MANHHLSLSLSHQFVDHDLLLVDPFFPFLLPVASRNCDYYYEPPSWRDSTDGSSRLGLFLVRGDSLLHIIMRNTHVNRPVKNNSGRMSDGAGSGGGGGDGGGVCGSGGSGRMENGHLAMATTALDLGFNWAGEFLLSV